MISTALHVIRAVLKRRFEPRRLNASILAFSSLKQISLISTALKPPGQSMNVEQNKDDRRHHSAKEAAAYRDSLFIFFT
ncbi:MAG: hypothetical protein IKF10_03565, partial [Lachnospiraceae bacterium]|nr:hypothetical protein [Lachnospiraceae bacterium]